MFRITLILTVLVTLSNCNILECDQCPGSIPVPLFQTEGGEVGMVVSPMMDSQTFFPDLDGSLVTSSVNLKTSIYLPENSHRGSDDDSVEDWNDDDDSDNANIELLQNYQCYINSVRSYTCEEYVVQQRQSKYSGPENFRDLYGGSATDKPCRCYLGRWDLKHIADQDFVTRVGEVDVLIVVDLEVFPEEENRARSIENREYLNNWGAANVTYEPGVQICLNTDSVGYHSTRMSKLNVSCVVTNSDNKQCCQIDEKWESVYGFLDIESYSQTSKMYQSRMEMEYKDPCNEFPNIFSNAVKTRACRDGWKSIGWLIIWSGIIITFLMVPLCCFMMVSFCMVQVKKRKTKREAEIQTVKHSVEKTTDYVKDGNRIVLELDAFFENGVLNRSAVAARMQEILLSEKIYDADVLRKARDETRFLSNNDVTYLIQTDRTPITYTGKRKVNPMMSSVFIIGLCLCCLIALSAACDMSLYTSSTNVECTLENGVYQCVAMINIVAELSRIGFELCVMIQDNLNQTSGIIKVKYDGLEVYQPVSNGYFSAGHEQIQQSVMHCRGTSWCPCPTCYSNMLDRTMNGYLTNPTVIKGPGETDYQTGAGSPFNGCAVSDSCVASGWGIRIKDVIFKVEEISRAYVYKPIITISSTFNSTVTQKKMFSTNDGIAYDDFRMFANGFLRENDIYFPPFYTHISWHARTPSLGSASFKNRAQTGSIGDVQGATIDSIQNGTFIYDPNMESGSTILNDVVTYTFHESGYDVASRDGSWIQIPANIGPNIWLTSPGGIVSNLTQSEPLLINLMAPDNYFFSRLTETPCPSSSSTGRISGCYDCDRGFKFNMTLVSTNGNSGFCRLTCDGIYLLQDTFPVSDVALNVTVSALSNDTEINVRCYVANTDGTCSTHFDLVGVLTQEYNLTQVGSVGVNNTYEVTCGNDPFSRSFNGCGSASDILITCIVFILGSMFILVLAVILFYLLYLICSWIFSKTMAKRKRRALEAKMKTFKKFSGMDQSDKTKMSDIRSKIISGRDLTAEDENFLFFNDIELSDLTLSG